MRVFESVRPHCDTADSSSIGPRCRECYKLHPEVSPGAGPAFESFQTHDGHRVLSPVKKSAQGGESSDISEAGPVRGICCSLIPSASFLTPNRKLRRLPA